MRYDGRSTPVMADPLPGSLSTLSLSLGGRDTHSSFELLVRAQDGDEAARNELCARYLPRLRRWAHGRLPVWAREHLDTEDIVQDTLLRSVRQLDVVHPAARARVLCLCVRGAPQSTPGRAAPRRAATGERRASPTTNRPAIPRRSKLAVGRQTFGHTKPRSAAAARVRPGVDRGPRRARSRLPRDCRVARQAVRWRRAGRDQPRPAAPGHGDGR